VAHRNPTWATAAAVKLAGKNGNWFGIIRGAQQGFGIFAPLLFNIYTSSDCHWLKSLKGVA